MGLIHKTAPIVSCALIAIATAFPSWAVSQTVAGTPKAAPDQLEEVIITAQKREQKLIDVPQSVTVVSAAALERQQAASFSDYLNLVPGLQLEQATPGQGRLVLRGINTGGVASTVAVYADETPFGSSSGLVNGAVLAGDFDTFDVARVEVLRGPQGTLYGASSLGGVVKFVTNEPQTDAVAMRARVGAESVAGGSSSYSGNAMVNVPLTSNLALRASGSYRKDGGFIDSIGTGGSDVQKDINGARNYGGRASLLFNPSDALSLRLSAVLQNIAADAPSTVESDPNTLVKLYGQLSQSQFVPQFSHVNYRVYNATIGANLGFANLTSSSSYSTQYQTLRSDLTFSLSPLVAAAFGTPNELYEAQNTNLKKVTQEVRLTSAKSQTVDWLVGGFYTHEDGLILQRFVPVIPGTLTEITTLPLLAKVSLASTYKEIAGFVNTTFHATDRFDIDLGGRYSHNKQDAEQVSDGALAGGPNTYPVATSSENVFTYSIAPKLKFGNQASVYARVAKGFRPGGPNVLPPGAPAGTPRTYDSDSLSSYEVGAKTQATDGRVSFDVSVYHLNWNDIQLFTVVNGFGVNANGTGAKSDGMELTATFRPIRDLELSVNGAYVNARLSGDTSPLIGGHSGDQLPFTPKTSVSLNGDYKWATGDTAQPYVGASVRFLGKQSGSYDSAFRAAHGRQRELASYSVIDLRAGLSFKKFDVEAYVKNLDNSDGNTSTSGLTIFGFPANPNGAIGAGVIRPRTIGLAVTAAY